MFRLLLVAAAAVTTALAQDFVNATGLVCPFHRDFPDINHVSSPGASVNSTGSVAFSFRNQDPWYLSVLGIYLQLASNRHH